MGADKRHNKIGKLNVGTEVELVDSAHCGEGLL
jgi:hypothetical protein